MTVFSNRQLLMRVINDTRRRDAPGSGRTSIALRMLVAVTGVEPVT